MTNRAAAFIVAATLTAVLPSNARAQTPDIPVHMGDKVWVTNLQGLQLTGEIVALSKNAVEVATPGGTKRMDMSEVWSIAKKDSNKNGFFIGAAIAILPAMELTSVSRPSHDTTSGRIGRFAQYWVVGGLMYGGIGAWIDSAFEHPETVYQKQADHVAVHIAPAVGPKALGLSGAISWK